MTIRPIRTGLRRGWALLGASVLSVPVILLSATGSAQAAAVPGVITDVTTSPASISAPDSQVTTTVTFCVPDGSHAGDTFSLQLPTQFVNYPGTFTVDATGGAPVMTATTSGTPAVMTFTLSSYVTTHTGTCGSVSFSANMDPSTFGTTQTLAYRTNDGTSFNSAVVVGDTLSHSPGVPFAYGSFTTPATQCTTTTADCLGWVMQGYAYSFGTVTLHLDAGDNWDFDCSTPITVQIGTLTGPGSSFTGGVDYPAATVTCTSRAVDVSYHGTMVENQVIQFSAPGTASAVDRTGNVTYKLRGVGEDNTTGALYEYLPNLISPAHSGAASGTLIPVTTSSTSTSTRTSATTSSRASASSSVPTTPPTSGSVKPTSRSTTSTSIRSTPSPTSVSPTTTSSSASSSTGSSVKGTTRTTTSTGPALAATGTSHIGGLLGIGIGLLVAGLLLVTGRRRSGERLT